MSLYDFINQLGKVSFGMTRDEAQQRGICIMCKAPQPLLTGVDATEYELSALCPKCFKEIGYEEER